MKILISGGGIAGLAAANFLHRTGHDVSVIDKAQAFRKLGYALSVKNFGLKIIAELGLREDLDRHSIQNHELHFYESNGKPLRTLSGDFAQKATLGSVLMLRSELHGVLHDAVKNVVPIRFGIHPTKIEQSDSGATDALRVSFSNGETNAYDLMVCAEGLRSSTRNLLFGDGAAQSLHPLGVTYVAGQIAGEHGLGSGGVHMYFGAGRSLFLIAMSPRDLVLQAFFRDDKSQGAPPVFSVAKVLEAFHSFSPDVLKQIQAFGANDYAFFDTVAMVQLPELSRGRVVFMGDAGYCPTFLSGMGASLGLLGAKVLSGALSSGEVGPALTNYNAVMRPVVAHFQHNAETIVKYVRTDNSFVAAIRNSVIHLMPPSLAALGWARQFDVEEKLLRGIV